MESEINIFKYFFTGNIDAQIFQDEKRCFIFHFFSSWEIIPSSVCRTKTLCLHKLLYRHLYPGLLHFTKDKSPSKILKKSYKFTSWAFFVNLYPPTLPSLLSTILCLANWAAILAKKRCGSFVCLTNSDNGINDPFIDRLSKNSIA
ncbi:MAG: hypothetical protein US11_C0003G0015 [Candidatus Roizmanbacteria bacterium GW2011_GWA2_36_23]|uniref:Uncharacterized protein n=1 Tax=Candidatus Roizmanbacteria bacterium GW2011_GWA2_36_23 TaxID=1618480 RepID=A0A0G0E8N2_9BACT|nr:MAG: hypothetical protein US11_C0003G0015 [Candidatus Roizmanbacteria bacterium GW2011_GWA2_36_23]